MIEKIRESVCSNNDRRRDMSGSHFIKRNSYKTSFLLIVFICDKTRLNLQVLSRQNEMTSEMEKILIPRYNLINSLN